ncbi:MAG: oligoendopeptidase F, partial [Pseudoleptotrichia goodfellowii]|nr:oligoendopeptidase F [Pseudoleptotrichia goodfellowii]
MAEKEIKKEYKWNLSDIYRSYKEWEKDFGKVQKLKDELLMYKGKFSDEKKLSEFLKKQEELDKIAYKL